MEQRKNRRRQDLPLEENSAAKKLRRVFRATVARRGKRVNSKGPRFEEEMGVIRRWGLIEWEIDSASLGRRESCRWTPLGGANENVEAGSTAVRRGAEDERLGLFPAHCTARILHQREAWGSEVKDSS